MRPNEQLHLILTNPAELDAALRDGWPLATEVVDAIRAGDYKELYQDEVGSEIMNKLEEAAKQEPVRG